MNCEVIREKVVDAIAGGEAELSTEFAVHLRSCEGCRSYYETEARLWLSIEKGMNALANQEMPESLLAGFRGRLTREPAIGRGWISAWSLAAAVAAVAILAFSYGNLRQRPALQPRVATNAVTSLPAGDNENPITQTPTKPVSTGSKQVYRLTHAPRARPVAREIGEEVIVLAEEREAFARFVREISPESDMAVALIHPALAEADPPVEIALLQMANLEVKPLEGTPSE